ncbi:hypothetical protein ACGH6Q_04030 [Gilliamella sp. BG2]|uniref:hypothetical protein n=1 Tax=Gilliamella sp. BG2 TaxID=3351509 RepID=UPI003987BC0A
MGYHLLPQAQATYGLNLSNNLIRRVFARNLFISSKSLSKLTQKILLVLLLMLHSLNLQALTSKSGRINNNHSDAIVLPSTMFINYVKPNLRYGEMAAAGWGMNHAGPPNIWDPKEGFLVQATHPSDYGLNFPTTGLDGLYFDLGIEGGDPSQLTWSVETEGDIKATVSWRRPLLYDSDIWIPERSREDYYVTRVTLNGPSASPSQINSDSPSRLKVPSLPQTFELVGRDGRGNEVKYGFVLKQWFVTRRLDHYLMEPFKKQSAWCGNLGYRMPRVSDLTNAKCGTMEGMPFLCDTDSAKPPSIGNYYQRQIGAGLLAEWGVVGDYGEKPSPVPVLWTSDFYLVMDQGSVMDFMGQGKDFIAHMIMSGQADFPYPVICTTLYE